MEFEIPGYDIIKVLYQSNTNVVCSAINKKTNKEVVIKFNAGPLTLKTKSSFSIEKNLIDQLKNNESGETLDSYGLEEIDGHMVLVMENGGQSLHDYLKEKGPLSIEQFLKVAIRVVRFLGYIHHNKIIHKDIKPSNILFNQASDHFYIIDFNISTLLTNEKESISNAKFLEGSLPYISPEQTGRMNRGIDSRTDIYSLGMTFYELLIGKLPFENNDAIEMIHYHMAKIFPSVHTVRKDIPEMIAKIIDKMIAKGAEDRYQNTHALIIDLEKCQEFYLKEKTIPDFPLGEHDKFMGLRIPDKPYGRDEDIEILMNSFEECSQGKLQLMIVKGPSGIGKTKLVNEVHRPIVAKTGLYMSGKFEQFKRDVPFSVFKHAFNELSKQLLVFGDARLKVIKDELEKEIGENGNVITEFAPQLNFLFGELPPYVSTSAFESISRFKVNVVKFFKVLSKKDHPIVIFIDDLQWADSASMELFNFLIFSGEIKNFLFIGAYRDNEMGVGHPFLKLIDDFQEKKVGGYNEIRVSPLDVISIEEMLLDITSEKEKSEGLKELADIIYNKTLGNPFFITEFIKFIHTEKLLNFNVKSGNWEWSLEEIKKSEVSENVVELMVSKIKKYDLEIQYTLNWGSCLGAEFDINSLALISGQSLVSIVKYLQKPLTDGLLVASGADQQILSIIDLKDENLSGMNEKINLNYKFVHDRVQEAANKIVDEDAIKEKHLKIGYALKEKFGDKNFNAEDYFDMVNHLNLGHEKITDSLELNNLSKLNFEASKKAIEKLAFSPALNYIRLAQDNLQMDHFETDHDEALQYNLIRVETEYLNLFFEEAEKVAFDSLRRCKNEKEKLPFFIHLLTMNSFQGKNREATEFGLKALKILGIKERITCGKLRFTFMFLKTLLRLRKVDFNKIPSFPELTNQEVIKFLDILSIMAPPTYLYNIELLIVLIFRGLILQMNYGISSETGFALSAFNAANMFFRLKFKNGQIIYSIVEKIYERFPNNKMRGRSNLVFQYTSSRTFLDPEEGLKMGFDSYNLSLNEGDSTYAATNLASAVYSDSVLGIDLERLYKNAEISHQACSKLKVYDMEWCSFIVKKMCKSFLGQNTNQTFDSLDDEDFVEDRDMDKIFPKEHNVMRIITLTVQTVRMLANKEYKKIIKLHFKNPNWPFALVGSMGFYMSIMSLTLSFGKLRNEISLIFNYLYRPFAHLFVYILNVARKNNPQNFGAFYYMTLAGLNLMRNQKDKALENFTIAAECCVENKYNYLMGLAYEFSAEILLEKGEYFKAQELLRKSAKSFETYGGKLKVKQLIDTYGLGVMPGDFKWDFEAEEKAKMDDNEVSQKSEGKETKKNNDVTIRAGKTMRASSKTLRTQSNVNFQSIFEASKILSGEIVFENLLEKMKETLVAILAPKKIVLSYITIDGSEKLEHKILVGKNDYPELLIKHSFENLKDVVLAAPFDRNGKVEGGWDRDDYFRTNSPELVAVFYLSSQRIKQGTLYLELEHSFKEIWEEQKEFFIPLMAQIAISLHNSKIYLSLEEKVKERTVEIRNAEKKMIEMAHRSGMADISTKIFGRIESIIPKINESNGKILGFCEGKKVVLGLENELTERKNGLDQVKDIKIGSDEKFKSFLEGSSNLIHCSNEFGIGINEFKENVDILSMIVKENKDFTHKKSVKVDMALSDLVEEVKSKFPNLFEEASDIKLVFDFSEETKVHVENFKYFFAINAIVKNAVEALKEKKEKIGNFSGEITIKIEGEGDNFTTKISDNGPGIQVETIDDVFKSGFTTKKGSAGIGLHDSYNYIGSIGGKIRASNNKNQPEAKDGASFEIEFHEAA